MINKEIERYIEKGDKQKVIEYITALEENNYKLMSDNYDLLTKDKKIQERINKIESRLESIDMLINFYCSKNNEKAKSNLIRKRAVYIEVLDELKK